MPAVERYPEPLARSVIRDFADDGVFERWYQRLESDVARWSAERPGLTGDALVKTIRNDQLMPREMLPVAVVGADARSLIGSSAQVLRQSADTTVKQIVKRAGQPVTAGTYLALQSLLDNAAVVVADSDKSVTIWSRVGAELYYCAIKTTASRDELYLLSLRRTSETQARVRLSPEQLELLGVA